MHPLQGSERVPAAHATKADHDIRKLSLQLLDPNPWSHLLGVYVDCRSRRALAWSTRLNTANVEAYPPFDAITGIAESKKTF